MAIPFLKINYVAPGGSSVEITDRAFTNNQRGVDLKSGMCSFKLSNSPYRHKSAGESIFKEDGVVEVFADYAPITEASGQLLFSGNIRELKPQFGEQGSTYEVVCADRTVLMLGTMQSKVFDTATPVDQIIKTVVSHSGSVGGLRVTTANVAALTTTGSAFPSITYSPGFKPVSEWISELSQPGYTGEDRAMMFYVDKTNDLHWFYPAQTVSASIVEGVNDITSWSMNRNSDAMVNMIIHNSGNDLNGNGILWYDYDTTSRTSAFKMKYYPFLDISNSLFEVEIAVGNLNVASDGTVPYKGKLYTPVASGTTSWGVVFSDFSAYNDAFRAMCKAIASQKAKQIIGRMGHLCWGGQVELKGTGTYTAGDLLQCTSATMGLSNYKLRVVDVTHTFDQNGWVTSLELKEDEQAISASV